MRLKRTLVSAIAALGLAASVMTPVALAAPEDDNSAGGTNETKPTVVVVDNGKFDVYFASGTLNLGTATINANNPEADKTGSFQIKYLDTKAYRDKFDVKVASTAFTSEGGGSIPASNLTIERTENVQQQYCGGPGSTACQKVIEYGDLGYYVNGDYVAQEPTGGVWTTKTYGLNEWQKVHFGYAGTGTGVSHGNVGVNLHVPPTTVPGTYTATMTLSVTAGGQP